MTIFESYNDYETNICHHLRTLNRLLDKNEKQAVNDFTGLQFFMPFTVFDAFQKPFDRRLSKAASQYLNPLVLIGHSFEGWHHGLTGF